MKGIPGTIQEGGAAFATTHWSVVAACTRDSETADAALSRLCRDYWLPLYTFARWRRYSPAQAQDLVQGFFAYLLQRKAYAHTDRRKGKFRSFLLASFKNYMTDAWDRARAFKRGGNNELVLLDDEIEAAEALYRGEPALMRLDEEQQYERAWAAALVARALERIEAEFSNGSAAWRPMLRKDRRLHRTERELIANPLSYEASHKRSHFGPAALERATASTLRMPSMLKE